MHWFLEWLLPAIFSTPPTGPDAFRLHQIWRRSNLAPKKQGGKSGVMFGVSLRIGECLLVTIIRIHESLGLLQGPLFDKLYDCGRCRMDQNPWIFLIRFLVIFSQFNMNDRWLPLGCPFQSRVVILRKNAPQQTARPATYKETTISVVFIVFIGAVHHFHPFGIAFVAATDPFSDDSTSVDSGYMI